MSKIQHIVLTPFDMVRGDHFKRDNLGRGTKNHDWYKERIAVFERYTLASMVAQSNQEFSWLIFFAPNTPTKEHWSKWQKLREFIPCLDRSRAEIIKVVDPKNEYLLTTRLDNDDCLASWALQRLRDICSTKPSNKFLNFLNGCRLDLKTGKAVIFDQETANTISYLERLTDDEPLTVWQGQHHHLDEKGPVEDVKTETPAWIQTINGRNISNALPRGQEIRIKKLAKSGFPYLQGRFK